MNKRTDKIFFEKYQKQIVWLFNTSFGRWFFRINKNYSSVGNHKITAVFPKAISWDLGYRYVKKVNCCPCKGKGIDHRKPRPGRTNAFPTCSYCKGEVYEEAKLGEGQWIYF